MTQPSLNAAIQNLIEWIKRLFRKKPEQIQSAILWSKASVYGDLVLIRRNTKNSVSKTTFQFHPRNEQIKYILACDRVVRNSKDKSYLVGIKQGMPVPGHPVPSHRLTLTKVDSNLTTPTILFSYPVDFIGIRSVSQKLLLQTRGLNPETIESLDLDDHSARIIVWELAALTLNYPWYKINWENEINRIAYETVKSNHEILLP